MGCKRHIVTDLICGPCCPFQDTAMANSDTKTQPTSFRSTLDVYTQAVTPAKHAAQAAVISLVFSSDDKDGAPLVAG